MESFKADIEVDLDENESDGSSEVVDLDALEDEYDIYAAECMAAMRLTLGRIENLNDAIDRSGERNPFDRIESRIKTFKSVKGKCQKRGYALTIEEIREKVKDVAGIRIITKYIDEVDKVKTMIQNMPGINIVYMKDYISTPKPNGYQSIHLSCQVEIHDPYLGSRLIPVEIQLRSKSMNLWATLEHDLKYKNPNPSPEVDEKFSRIAKILRQFDEEAIALRDYNETAESNTQAKNGSEKALSQEISVLKPMTRSKKPKKTAENAEKSAKTEN